MALGRFGRTEREIRYGKTARNDLAAPPAISCCSSARSSFLKKYEFLPAADGSSNPIASSD